MNVNTFKHYKKGYKPHFERCFGGGIVLKKIKEVFSGKISKKHKKNDEKRQKQLSAQEWIPIEDLHDGILKIRGRKLISAIRVEPTQFKLLSIKEQRRRITAVFEAIQALNGDAQILSLPRPIDLDSYILYLDDLLRETDSSRKGLLRNYRNYVRDIAMGAEANERRFYFILTFDEEKVNKADIDKYTREIASSLSKAQLETRICDDSDVIDFLFVFFNPRQASFERPIFPESIPVYKTKTVKELMRDGIN